MASGKKSKGSKAVVWVILILLIVGLAGFGATNFGGTVTSIGKVGDREIDVQRYARDLQAQMSAFSAQLGTNLTMAQAQAFGIDRAVLQQLVSTAAVENEAAELGLSAGDEEVRTQILSIPAFQGMDGKFDREAYRFALSSSGLNEQAFEENLRAEIARSLVQRAVGGGLVAPDVYTQTLVNFVGERRSFAWAVLGVDDLDSPVAEPTDADLRAYFSANEADFMLPETRAVTYAWLTPDMIVDSIQIDEASLRQLYDDRIDEFVKPERRLVERLVLGEDAEGARARLDAGEATFEELVAERGLTLADIDMGDVAEDDLYDGGDAVFAMEEPGIVGPIDTELGDALFRVNAILAAQETTYEEARAQLLDEFALDSARRAIGDQVENIDDLLAGGATLEELANETELQLGQIDWTAGLTDGISAYDAFRSTVQTAETGDFPEVTELEDGGIFALRIDEIIAPRLQEFAQATGQATSGWIAAETAAALAEQAGTLAGQLKSGTDAADLGITLTQETGLTRESFIPDTPLEFQEAVFAMSKGEIRVVQGDTAAYLVRLDAIAPPDAADEDLAARRSQLEQATQQSMGTDLLQAYSRAIEAQAGISLNQAAINAVHTQFP